MPKTSRRSLIKVAAAGSLAAALPAQHHKSIPGPLANATVTFGEWRTDPPLDRFNTPFTPDTNMHHILPNEVTIKAGGAVNFIISGFHLILVYDNGTQPSSIDITDTLPGPPAPLINDDTNRIYRGLDPRVQPLDRIEAVHFPSRGRYLVICGVFPHFVNGMFTFVNVLP
jgi:hypothetical protein